MEFYNLLNETGKRNFNILIGVGGLAFVISIFVAISARFPIVVAFGVVAGPMFYAFLMTTINTVLRMESLKSLGFQLVHGSDNLLLPYDISNQGKIEVVEIFEGSVSDHPFRLIGFAVSSGSGNSRDVKKFVGVEFETKNIHLPVQIYDKENIFKPIFRKQRILESNDFHRYFDVYSNNPKNPFYQLDPDSMHDLLELRKELGFGINIESQLNKILIYVGQEVFDDKLKHIVKFSDILNQQVDPKSVQKYREETNKLLATMVKFYQTLDYKLAEKN